MALKDVHDKVEEIPEEFRSLYTEKAGKWELTGIQGVKTSADVARLQEGLTKERNEHKATKDKLAAWGDLKPDEVTAKLDTIPELEAAAKGKLDDAKIEEIVARRVDGTIKSKLAPVERENARLKQEAAEAKKLAELLQGEKKQRRVHDDVRSALLASKVRPEAHEDALLLADRVFELSEDGKTVTRDGVGVTPGLEPAAWLSEIQSKRAHWWPGSEGGGAPGSGRGGGGGGGNPWSAAGWNLTEQGAYVRKHGQAAAEQMAKAAGTTFGGPRPQPAKR